MAKRRPKHHSKKSEPIFKEKKDLYGLLVLCIALLFAVIIYTKASGIFGEKINEILELIFGVGKYAIPFILFAWSISFLVREEKANYKQIGIGLLITFISILGLIHLRASRNQMLNRNFITTNGGYIGGYLTYYLSKFIGKIATSIILLLSLIISTLILTRKSLKEIRDDIKNLSMKLKFKKPILKKPHILTRESEKVYTSAELKEKKSKPKHTFEPIEKFERIYKTKETLHNKLILYETSPTQLVMSVASVVEDKTYKIPPLSLLQKSKTLISTITKKNVKDVVRTLERILSDFKIEAKVSDVTRGPNVTLFSIQLAPGVKVRKILTLENDLCVALGTPDLRILTPIPGKAALGLEVPNKVKEIVTLGDILLSPDINPNRGILTVPIGKDLNGEPVFIDIVEMPHLLIAGATGSGKSSCLNNMLTSLLYQTRPWDVKFLMIDPKMVELNVFDGIPHLLTKVVTKPKEAAAALAWVVREMEQRFEIIAKARVRSIEQYNANLDELNQQLTEDEEKFQHIPYIIVFIDELYDLMIISASEVEDSICRIAQMARAVGIHLIVATQRPSVNVITGIIKANIPSRIAFNVTSGTDSRVILDQVGAEKLIGKGDMLYLPTAAPTPIRIQGAFVTQREVESTVSYIKNQVKPKYIKGITDVESKISPAAKEDEALVKEALKVILKAGYASVSLLQRRLRLGYSRAGRLIDILEDMGVISGYAGSKPREVLITEEEFEKIKSSNLS
ncbi:MAG: DNA translocase FtsK 4TM domain-containing protein [Candidatus Humimicrobiia bacterium]